MDTKSFTVKLIHVFTQPLNTVVCLGITIETLLSFSVSDEEAEGDMDTDDENWGD